MPNFITINDVSEINSKYPPLKWKESQKFNSKSKSVDIWGNYVQNPVTSPDQVYKLVSKKERNFHYFELFGRRFFGIMLIAISIGLAPIFFKYVRNLFWKTKQSVHLGILLPKTPQQIIREENCLKAVKREQETKRFLARKREQHVRHWGF